MFNKKNKNGKVDHSIEKNIEDTESLEKEIDFFNVLDNEALSTFFKENWNDNRVDVLVKLFTNSSRSRSDFLALLSVFLFRSLQVNAISTDELTVLGIDMIEVTSLVNAVSGSDSNEELLFELNVRAAVKEIERTCIDIMIQNDFDTSKVESFQALLAKTSLENSIYDLRATYKFLLATSEDNFLVFKK